MSEQHVLSRFSFDNKQRSMSISNAILAHLRASGKKVSLNNGGDIVVGSLSGSNATSNDTSSTEDESEDSEDEDRRSISPCHKLPSVPELRASPGPDAYSLQKLKRFLSHPHSAFSMSNSLASNSPYMSYSNSQVRLPEFNKRPLTDTPIVSVMPSPETRYHSSDDEAEPESPAELNEAMAARAKKALRLSPKEKMRTTKNISHLSLADLNMISAKVTANVDQASGSVSPKDTLEKFEVPRKNPSVKFSTDSPEIPASPSGVTPTAISPKGVLKQEKSKLDPSILKKIRADLLRDVPEDLQKQFEKTPSFEKLKSMLLLKKPPKQKAYTLNIPGQTSSKVSPDGKIASVDVGSKLVIVMVGLPARGKSYITSKLTRYLNWIQHDCRVFNVGNTRRMDKTNVLGPAHRPLPDNNTPLPHTGRSPDVQPLSPTSHSADFFNPENKESTEIREKWAMDTLDSLLDWVLMGSGSVGILDATNSTKKRRLKVLKRIQERTNGELKVLFMESICSDPAILDTNIHLKLSGPDYKEMDPELALKDFLGRLRNYERAYETIDETEEAIEGFQYVKMINVGKKVVSYNVQGFLASQTVYFLLNFNLCERQIWLTRHGESVDNLSGRIGGDSKLTKRGKQFSKALSKFMTYKRQEFRKNQLEKFSKRLELRYNELLGKSNTVSTRNDNDLVQLPNEPNFCVWTSMLIRAVETGKYFSDQEFNVKAMRMLNELGGGKFEGMTYAEIKKSSPKEFEARFKNKLGYRYPGVGGESYLDVLVRLRPLINEVERTTDHLVIVSHRVVLRVLLAYFLNLDKSSIVELDVPLHTLYCLELKPYGTDYTMYEYDEISDWFTRIEPEHRKNVKEMGVNFRERKYSVIPTAPPLAKNTREKKALIAGRSASNISNFSVRNSLLRGDERIAEEPNTSSKKLSDLQKLRKPQVKLPI